MVVAAALNEEGASIGGAELALTEFASAAGKVQGVQSRKEVLSVEQPSGTGCIFVFVNVDLTNETQCSGFIPLEHIVLCLDDNFLV